MPASWKIACGIPIYKSGPRNDIQIYRPISITSLICKCQERIISQIILNHLKANNFLNPNQHGFVPGKSCVTLLADVLDDWFMSLNMRDIKQVDVVTLDWCKAFDRVPHARLVDKLFCVYIRGNLQSWIRSFLTSRFQVVAYKGRLSDLVPVISGVIQGSVIGPFLFTIFMLDLS